MSATPRLILITDTARFHGEPFFDTVRAALTGGVDAVLVREKRMDSARLLAFAAELRQITRQFQASLIIHSQLDIALAIDADGIHLAAADIPHLPRLRGHLSHPDQTLSASCHNRDEVAQAAALGADFVTLSPLFATASHPGTEPLGVASFKRIAAEATLPVVALGGIDRHNCARIQGFPLAVISAIAAADEPQRVATELATASKGALSR